MGTTTACRACEAVGQKLERHTRNTVREHAVAIEPETIERLCKIASIVAIKEAAGSLDQVSDILERTNLTVLSGDDSLTLPMLAVGSEGVVSVVGNIVPRDVIGLIEAFQAGNLVLAQSIHRRLFPLCRDLLGLASNPSPIKAALALLGRGTAEVRLPMVSLDDRLTDLLRTSLVRYGLLKPSAK